MRKGDGEWQVHFRGDENLSLLSGIFKPFTLKAIIHMQSLSLLFYYLFSTYYSSFALSRLSLESLEHLIKYYLICIIHLIFIICNVSV